MPIDVNDREEPSLAGTSGLCVMPLPGIEILDDLLPFLHLAADDPVLRSCLPTGWAVADDGAVQHAVATPDLVVTDSRTIDLGGTTTTRGMWSRCRESLNILGCECSNYLAHIGRGKWL